MNFPIQACSACGEQTESLFCPNCRRKLNRDEIKVFWNAQSWAQYRATVLDFKNYTASLPHLETRVLDMAEMDQQEEAAAVQPIQPARGKNTKLVVLLLLAIALLALGLWWGGVFRTSNQATGEGGEPQGAEAQPERGGTKKRGPGAPELIAARRTPRPGETPGASSKTRGQQGGEGYADPAAVERRAIEEMCGVEEDASTTEPEILPYELEEACAVAQGGTPGPKPAPTVNQQEIEDLCSAEAGTSSQRAAQVDAKEVEEVSSSIEVNP